MPVPVRPRRSATYADEFSVNLLPMKVDCDEEDNHEHGYGNRIGLLTMSRKPQPDAVAPSCRADHSTNLIESIVSNQHNRPSFLHGLFAPDHAPDKPCPNGEGGGCDVQTHETKHSDKARNQRFCHEHSEQLPGHLNLCHDTFPFKMKEHLQLWANCISRSPQGSTHPK